MKNFTWRNVKQLLSEHYSAPLYKVFRQFRNGAIFFAVGMMIIYLSLTAMPPSAKQEFILLCGILIAAGGFVVAILAHIRMIIGRVVHFFRSK